MRDTHFLGRVPRLGIGGFFAGCLSPLRGLITYAALAMVALAATATGASAETLLMPTRDARIGVPVVVWGVHTQPDGIVAGPATVCSLNFGDGTGLQACTGVDRSYVAYAHTYAGQGTYTITLTVGFETTTTSIQVFDPTLLVGGSAGDNNRSLGINMAIQDGLRYLWTQQSGRGASFPSSITTSWNSSGFPAADTSQVVSAFQNQGYKRNTNPTGIYEKYIVRRGHNFVLSDLSVIDISSFPVGNSPCVGVPAATFADCKGFGLTDFHQNYETANAILSIAGSGILTTVNTEVAGVTNGKTYGEILQRMLNTIAWGQNDSGAGQGGWYYNFNNTSSDGSAVGWDILAILDATAAGATLPTWVTDNFKAPGKGLNASLNTDGSFDYQSDANPASDSSSGPQKIGIGLQGLFLIGETTGARVAAVKNAIDSWWNGPNPAGVGGDNWGCGSTSAQNKGCAYSMYNNFKGLKLQNIATLPSVTRPAGPGAQPAGDWYADYQDWLVANQDSPGTTTGGSWPTGVLGWSCCASGPHNTAAIAELILSPVALVAPDPILFSTVGLSPLTAVNPVGTNHTVTAFAQAANNAPVPGVTINFKVMTGPNTGKVGSGTTGADGKTSFTYHDDGGAGTDTIQAFIGSTLSSNVVTKVWGLACDVNGDGKVSPADLLLIRSKNNTVATGPNDPYDVNHDGVINVSDVRYCQLRMTATTP